MRSAIKARARPTLEIFDILARSGSGCHCQCLSPPHGRQPYRLNFLQCRHLHAKSGKRKTNETEKESRLKRRKKKRRERKRQAGRERERASERDRDAHAGVVRRRVAIGLRHNSELQTDSERTHRDFCTHTNTLTHTHSPAEATSTPSRRGSCRRKLLQVRRSSASFACKVKQHKRGAWRRNTSQPQCKATKRTLGKRTLHPATRGKKSQTTSRETFSLSKHGTSD